jgi:MFS family permease
VVLWSVFTITTPPAAAASLPALLGNRAVMGAGEGVTFPCVQNIVKGWVPADTRTRALTLIYSGGQLGTIVALVTAPLIIKVCSPRGREDVVQDALARLHWGGAGWARHVAEVPTR